MPNQSPYLFTESNFGGLPLSATSDASPAVLDAGRTEPPVSFVETLGFPKGTCPALLVQVLEVTCTHAPGTRVDHLRSPGVLSRLFSHSAAEASYALAILAIVESPAYASTLARLKAAAGPATPKPPARP
jgi:hypothetical protein